MSFFGVCIFLNPRLENGKFLHPKKIIPDVHPSINGEVRLAMFIIHHNFTQLIEGEFKESAAIEKLLVAGQKWQHLPVV